MTMEVNEDDPEDVKRATPVEQEIKRGEKDETFERYPRPDRKRQKWQHCEKLAAKKSKTIKAKDEGCCETKKIGKEKTARDLKRMTVMVPEKPCTLPKLEIVPRQNLSKQQYIDMLATPSRKCPSPCARRAVTRKLRPISERIKELALPTPRRMMITLQEAATKLSPALVDNLIKTIEGESCLTPEQAAEAFQERKRRKKKSKKGRGRESPAEREGENCEETRRTFSPRKSRKTWSSGDGVAEMLLSLGGNDLDPEAVIRQYLIAERFVRSILDWKCPIPREEFSDIAEVVLRRLGEVLEYSPLDDEDRKSQQMRFVADLIGCWIAGILLEVAEDHKQEIEEECEQKRKEMEEDLSDSEEEKEEMQDKGE